MPRLPKTSLKLLKLPETVLMQVVYSPSPLAPNGPGPGPGQDSPIYLCIFARYQLKP